MHNIVEDLKPLAVKTVILRVDPDNPRSGHDLDGIAASLKKYGQRKPIVVNRSEDNTILAGAGTFTAAVEILGWDEIAAVFVEDDAQTADGYNLADNRLTDLSYFEPEAFIQMAMSVDDVPGMESIREMILTVEDETEFALEELDEDEFSNTIVLNVSIVDYERFIEVKEKSGFKKDEKVFAEMLTAYEDRLK